MTKLQVYTDQFFKVFKAILYSSGVFPKENSTVYYTIYSFVILTTFHFGYTAFMILYFFKSNHIQDLVQSVFMCLLEVMSCIYITNLLINIKEIRRAEEMLQSFDLKNENEERFVNAKLRFVKQVFIYFFISTNIGCAGLIIGHVFITSSELIYYAWYPFDWQHNVWLYWITIVYQAVGMQFGCVLHMTNQYYPVFLMLIIKLQLEVLGARLNNINRKVGLGKNEGEKSPSGNSPKNDLIEFIKLHQEICK